MAEERPPSREPSHSRGAPEVPEPLTVGAQHLTRYTTGKKCVRATRPVLVCAINSPKNEYTHNFFIVTGSSSLKELNWSGTFRPKPCSPYRGVTLSVGSLSLCSRKPSVFRICAPLPPAPLPASPLHFLENRGVGGRRRDTQRVSPPPLSLDRGAAVRVERVGQIAICADAYMHISCVQILCLPFWSVVQRGRDESHLFLPGTHACLEELVTYN